MRNLLLLIGIIFSLSSCDDKIDIHEENELLLGDWKQLGYTTEEDLQNFISLETDTIVYDYEIFIEDRWMTIGVEKIFFYDLFDPFRTGRDYEYLKGFYFVEETDYFIVYDAIHRDIRYLSDTEVVFLQLDQFGNLVHSIYRKVEEEKEEE